MPLFLLIAQLLRLNFHRDDRDKNKGDRRGEAELNKGIEAAQLPAAELFMSCL